MTPADRENELATTPIWQLTQARYQFLKGVKQPHVMEISLVQMSRFSRRGKERYQRERAAEWDASGACKVEYNRLVWEAYQRGEFNAEQTHVVAQALFWFAFSLPFNGIYLLLTRTFFSLQAA